MALINGTNLNNSLSGTALADVINGFDGNDTLYGQGGDDQLFGDNGNDVLNGGTGADFMDGGSGNDTFHVDNAGDVVSGGADTDLVQVTLAAGLYTLAGDVENATAMGSTLINLQGNGLGNVLTGNTGSNQLFGAGGNDTLNGGTGADYMEGGADDDTYVVDNVGDTVVEAAAGGTDLVQVTLTSGTYTLGAEVENGQVMGSSAASIVGNTMDNYLTGSGGANTLSGLGGNDTLDGGAGNDRLIGGIGDDLYIVNVAGDVIVEATGEGADHVQVAFTSAGTYTLSDYIETATVTSGAQGVNITGNFQANLLTGSALNNVLSGGGGNDTLEGLSGNDTLDGGAGTDRAIINGNFGDFAITAAPSGLAGDIQLKSLTQTIIIRGVEVLQFNDGDKVVAELSIPTNGNDFLTMTGVGGQVNALAGNDTIIGTTGDDTIDGGKGDDLMSGGLGDDVYYLDSLTDSPVENPGGGNDKIYLSAASGTYVLPTEVEWIQVTSTGAVNVTGHNTTGNTITGGSGANILTGGTQNDTLDGGLGNDKLIGGLGDDLYVVNVAGDVVTENVAEGTDTVRVAFTAAGTYALSANVENAVAVGAVNVNITGNFLNNELTGNDGNNLLNSGEGNDTVIGSLGNDTVDGGIGSLDMLDLSAYGTSGDWTVTRVNTTDIKLTYTLLANTSVTLRNVEFVKFIDTTTSPESLLATASTPFADNLYLAVPGTLDGGAGNDTLHGSSGNDTLIGGTGNDVMYGGAGNDTYRVDSASDVIVENSDENPGDNGDTVEVFMTTGTYALGLGNDLEIGIIKSTGAVNLTGNELDNTLTGGKGANILIGGAGADTISGGNGADVLTGGEGNDMFMFNFHDVDNPIGSTNVDKITDFVNGEDHITIDLSASLKYGGVLGGAADLDITTSTYFRYNAATGALTFDEDGFGVGKASINIAILGTTTHPAFLLASDVTIIG